MITRAVLRPGQKGTHRLVQKYGERLVCVRYRYDYPNKTRYKTVELIIDAQPWEPPPPHPQETRAPTREVHYTRQVAVRIGYEEKDLQRQIKTVGGAWSRTEKVWYANEYYVRQIGLGDRIVK